jgi:aspartyl-tRNA(Asn)/glutamyl-tRNA(Gln) amidotransferase subunit C
VIDRQQVLHVARLSRLRLDDRIRSLDLEGVEPTSHVVQLENVLRADEPWESMPPTVALANAPEPFEGAFRVPSPQADAD